MSTLKISFSGNQSDAVAESMASRLSVDKSDILNRDSESMAVGLALSETHIINETKKYLEEVWFLSPLEEKSHTNPFPSCLVNSKV